MVTKKSNKPLIVSINSLFLGVVTFVCCYLILLSSTPLNVKPDLEALVGNPGSGNVNGVATSPSVGRSVRRAEEQSDFDALPDTSSTIDPPKRHAFTKSDDMKLIDQTIYMHGERLNFVVREEAHIGLIKAHVFRETAAYALLKDAVEQARRQKPEERPLVVDIGSNHGLFALFAARLGADVIAVEPQVELADLIEHSARTLNGNDVAERIKVYNYAVLSTREFVSMEGQEEGEGAAANVVRGDTAKPGMVETRPISDFISPDENRDIAFLKIDVEGFELHAIPSANKLFASRRARNVLIEYGPPNRWKVAKNTPAQGVQILADAKERFGFSVRLIDSEVWDKYVNKLDEGAKNAAGQNRMIPLETAKMREDLIQTMDGCPEGKGLPCEGYIWYTMEPGEQFSTFMSDCGLNKQYDKRLLPKKRKLRRTPDGIVSMGCEGTEMKGG